MTPFFKAFRRWSILGNDALLKIINKLWQKCKHALHIITMGGTKLNRTINDFVQ